MTEIINLASYQQNHHKYDVNYHSSESPALRYQAFFRGTKKEWIQKVNLPIMGADDLEAQGHHPCFNWHHYLVNKAIEEPKQWLNLERFVSFVHQVATEIDQHHRLGVQCLVNEESDNLLPQLVSLANQYPFVEFIMYKPISPKWPHLRVFIGWNQGLCEAISPREFEDFIRLVHDVRPDIAFSLSKMKRELLRLQPAELLAASVKPYRAKDPIHIASGGLFAPWEAHLPQALLDESETRRCLLARIEGYPLTLLFGTE